MSSSPFEIFRRNLKPLMVALTLLALFAFVVLPALDTYLRRGSMGGGDAQLATFDGTPVMASRVSNFTRNHYETVQFLNALALETIRRKGQPQTAGFQYNAQTNQVQSLGIYSQPSELASIRTFQFASEANKAGFELDDTSIRTWLQRFTDGTMPDSEIVARFMQSTRNQLGQYHLYETLRQLLLARLFQDSIDTGLAAGNIPGLGEIPVVTPAQHWENFLKLKRQATVTTYGVLVDEFIDQTAKNPSESEIEEVYEEGKSRLPLDQSPEPGFRRPTVAEFEYVAANLNSFIDREVDNITEEQLRAEYERRKAGGDFQIDDQTMADLGIGETEDGETEDGETEDGENVVEESDEATSEAMTPNQEKQADAPEPSADLNESDSADDGAASDSEPANPVTDESAADEPVAEEPTAKEAQMPADADADVVTEPEPAPESEPKSDETGMTQSTATRLVATFAQEDDQTEDDQAEDDQTEGENEQAPAGAETADDEQAETTEPDGETDATEEPKFESFDDVRNEIADDLARPPAAQKLDEAITEVNEAMELYFKRLSIHESNLEVGSATPADAPERPDLEKMADELGLEYGVTEPSSIDEISEQPIGNSVGTGTSLDQRGPPFAIMMFGFENSQQAIPSKPVFSPLVTVDLSASKTYATWKVSETETYEPSLDEAREEVIMAIRRSEARELALAEAKRIAELAKASPDKPLAEFVSEDKQDNIQTGLGPFSWMNSVGFGQVSIGNVPELDSVGPDFMRSTFTTEVGGTATAMNAPERVAYVIQPESFQPSLEELREQFLQDRERMMAQFLTNSENNQIRTGFYESLDERTGFEFTPMDD